MPPRPPSTPARSVSYQMSTPTTPASQTPESPQSITRRQVHHKILSASAQGARRKRSTIVDLEGPNESTYTSYGRNFGRMGDLFNRISTIVEYGLVYEMNTPESSSERSREEENLLESWRLLKELIPNFASDMISLRGDRRTRNQVFSLINKARDSVRSDDSSSLKLHAPSYMLFSKHDAICPPLLKGDKTLRGWAHPQCARLLCPAELPPTEETYAKIESGLIVVTSDQFPRFLYPDGHVFDPDDVSKDILRGHFCYRVGKHIFQGPSASHEKAGFHRGKSGNAAINGISSMTPRSIAYIACQARFSISSASQWGFWDKDFDYKKFYWNIVDLFKDGEGQDIIDAFNYEIFGTSDTTTLKTKTQPVIGPSNFDVLHQQRAAKRARLLMEEQQREEQDFIEPAQEQEGPPQQELD